MNKLCILILFMSLLFSGCYTNKTVSDFVKTDVELGITKDGFIKKFGDPYSINKEVNKEGDYQEMLSIKKNCIKKHGISLLPRSSLLMASRKSRRW